MNSPQTPYARLILDMKVYDDVIDLWSKGQLNPTSASEDPGVV
jgi:hypothetical protein